MSQLSTGKKLGQLDLSTLSYDQMNEYYLFGHFPGIAYWSPRLGQFLGQLRLVFWARFLHQSYVILSLVSFPIGLEPIGVT